MTKSIKTIIVTAVIAIANFVILANTVQAVESERITVYEKGQFNKIIKFDGTPVKTTHVVCNQNGVEYPAYCLNVKLPGAGDEISSYETINKGKITDLPLWRVIINGYPYKTLEQLGVANEQEAYIATKQAIYCHLYGRGAERYTGMNDEGNRTVNAIAKILNNARNSEETIENPNMQIIRDK